MDMRHTLLSVSFFIFLISCCLFKLFGIPVALILSGAIGTVAGVYKKDASVWKWSVVELSVGILSIVGFAVLLLNSNM